MGASLQVRVSEATDAILTGALGWISCNPMPSMKLTAKKRPQPRRPTPEQMARIVEATWNAPNEWGLYGYPS